MKQSKNLLFKRYVIFFVGLVLNSFGVAMVTKCSLGTSPIAVIPYSLSLIIPKLSLGWWTIIFSFLLIVAQIVLLKRSASKMEIVLQAIISFVFGYSLITARERWRFIDTSEDAAIYSFVLDLL